jgi:acyl CoA:acetate/3-ketoacid CoA transferase alpha subunit
MPINKVVKNAEEACIGIADGMTLMVGGFGLCGIPENCITELVSKGVKILRVFRTMPAWMILVWVFCFKPSK